MADLFVQQALQSLVYVAMKQFSGVSVDDSKEPPQSQKRMCKCCFAEKDRLSTPP